MHNQGTRKQASLSNTDGAFETLRQLEKQVSEEARQQRAHKRVQVKARVVIQPGNISQTGGPTVQGVTGDISASGCRAMLPVPVQTGDVYRLQFDGVDVGEPSLFARCLRCRLIEDSAFEAGFQFFQPVSPPAETDPDVRQAVAAV